MKTRNTILVALMGLLLGAGCASENGGPVIADPGAYGYVFPGTPEVPLILPSTGTYSGSTVPLQANISVLKYMFFNSNPVNPTNVHINIDLHRPSESIIISYNDNGRTVEAALGVVHPYSGRSNNSRNGWVEQNGKMVWKGFFQDSYGAIVLIVDQNVSQGDGQGATLLGGSLWVQNFGLYDPAFMYAWPSMAPLQGSELMCWEIEMGPYDCRSFMGGMTSEYYPTSYGPHYRSPYKKLGEFSGLVRDQAGF